MAFLKKRNKTYYVYWKDLNGKSHAKAISKTKAIAEQWKKKCEYNLEMDSLGLIKKNILLNEAIEQFLEYKEVHLRPRSFDEAKTSLNKHMTQNIKKRKISDINLNDIDSLERNMLKDGYAPKTINKVIMFVKSFLNYCVKQNWIVSNPAKGRKELKIPDSELKYYTPQELKLIEKYAEPNEKPMILFLRYTGVRRDEMRFAKINWVDLHKKVINIKSDSDFTTKTFTQRSIPISNKLLPTIKKIIKENKSGYLFETLQGKSKNHPQRIITKICNRIKQFEDIDIQPGIHKFRHSFGTILASKGVSLHQIGELMGHTRSETTKIYAKFLPGSLDKVIKELE